MPGIPMIIGTPVEMQGRCVLRTNTASFFVVCGEYLSKEEIDFLLDEAILQDRFGIPEAIIWIEKEGYFNGAGASY